MALPVSFPFVGTPAFYTGTAESSLVPEIFPVAINGRPYVVDIKSGRYTRQFDARVRDSQDSSTSPGESAINPQGLWRRGQASWHNGAGQKYADDAAAGDYQFYKSKGVNVWTKGQLSLLNDTKLSLSSAATNQHMIVQDGYTIVSMNGDLKYSSDPFASSPTWTDMTGEPAATVQALATDGTTIYVAFASDGIRSIDATTTPWSVKTAKYVNTTDSYYMLGFAKNYMFGAHDHKLRYIAAGGGTSDKVVPDDTGFRWVGVATGQNAVYAAGYAGKKSLVYKITITSAGVLDTGVVALELPTGEVITSISGYLGNILIGTNKGVRYCSTDGNSNLVAGSLIPTSNPVYKFASNDRFSYFTWSNYDGTSGGLGRLDLSSFTSANTPAFATDLMYNSTADVTNVVIVNDKPVFTVSGVGVVVYDANNCVSSGSIETGIFRWGIPDRKFAPRVDIRVQPLVGSVSAYVSTDNSSYVSIGSHTDASVTEHTFIASEEKFIEAGYKFVLNKSTGTDGPTVTRWMSRAYAAPARSRVITVPILLHKRHNINNRDYYFDVALERDLLEELASDPEIVTYQEKDDTFSVIVEDCQWQPYASSGTDWLWEGTMTVIMRTITE